MSLAASITRIQLRFHYIDFYLTKLHLLKPHEYNGELPPELNWLLNFAEVRAAITNLNEQLLQEAMPCELVFSADDDLNPSHKVIHLLLCHDKALRSKKLYDLLKKLRPIDHSRTGGTEQPFKHEVYAPLIVLGEQKISDLFTRKVIANHLRRTKQSEMDARVKYFDSSIWNRYVYLLSDPKTLKDQLQGILSLMINNHQNGIYHTYAAKAALEFQTRLAVNSFITPIGSNGHDTAVTPFKFHSETWMKEEAEGILTDFFEKKQGLDQFLKEKLRWRFLLIDDHANQPISADETTPCRLSKKQVIEALLGKFNLLSTDDKGSGITVEFTEAANNIIEAGLEKMRKKTYDILLLDYLLERNTHFPTGSVRDYGYQFLFALQRADEEERNNPPKNDSDEKKKKVRKGPLLRHWIVPISSFPHAFSDMLHQLGLSPLTPLWHLSPGGDPVTTPYLFMYNLLEFMKNQVEECYLYPKRMQALLERYDYLEDHRVWAKILRREIQEAETKQDLLQEDYSRFARSMTKTIPTQYSDMLAGLIKCLRLLQDWRFHVDSSKKVTETWNKFLQEKLSDESSYKPILQKLYRFVKDRFLYKNKAEALKKVKQVNDKQKITLSLTGLYLEELPEEIKNCTYLRELHLSGNKLHPESQFLKYLETLKSLRRLDLSGNHFDKLPREISQLKDQLHYLNFKGNPMSAELGEVAEAKDGDEVKTLITVLECNPKIKSLIANGELSKAITEALKYAQNIFNTNFEKDITTLSGSFNDLEYRLIKGFIDDNSYSLEKNRISRSLLNLLDIYSSSKSK